MIKDITYYFNGFEIFFDNNVFGKIIFCENEVEVENKKKCFIPMLGEHIYKNDKIFFKDLENNKEYEIYTFEPSFLEKSIISPPNRSLLIKNKNLTGEQLFLISRNICNSDENVFIKANANLIMSYRALEHENIKAINESITKTLDTLNSLYKSENDDFSREVKFVRNHCLISNELVAQQLYIYTNNEEELVKSFNRTLDLIKSHSNEKFIKWSYYSISMILNLISLYNKQKYGKMSYSLSFKLYKASLNLHEDNEPTSRMRELQQSYDRLLKLHLYINDKYEKIENLFNASIRCKKHNIMYTNMTNFTGNLSINF